MLVPHVCLATFALFKGGGGIPQLLLINFWPALHTLCWQLHVPFRGSLCQISLRGCPSDCSIPFSGGTLVSLEIHMHRIAPCSEKTLSPLRVRLQIIL